VRAARRKSRNSNPPSVKVSKVKIAMPQATVVLSGKDLSMSRVVDLLTETLKEARKVADVFDVKTWEKMMADKSKGGV
jgi:ParB family transcriptional regulator, chromosome partitioning protein